MASDQEIEQLWTALQPHLPLLGKYHNTRYWMSTVLGRQVWHDEYIEVRDKLETLRIAVERLTDQPTIGITLPSFMHP